MLLLLRDVVTAVGIELEGHGGHSGSMDDGRTIHVGLHARICRPRRLGAVQPWPATAKNPSPKGGRPSALPHPGREPPDPCNKVVARPVRERRFRPPDLGTGLVRA